MVNTTFPDGVDATLIVDDVKYELAFVRRKYSSGTTFTWVSARVSGDFGWTGLADPWPCVRPKNVEITAAIRRLPEHQGKRPDIFKHAFCGRKVKVKDGLYVGESGVVYGCLMPDQALLVYGAPDGVLMKIANVEFV